MFNSQFEFRPEIMKKNIDSIFSEGIERMNTLLSLSNIVMRDSDLDLMVDLVKCKTSDEIILWQKKYINWWRVVLIIMDPQYRKHFFWMWDYRSVFISLMAETFPVKRNEVVFRLYLEHYNYFLLDDKYSSFAEMMDLLSLKFKNNASSWCEKFLEFNIQFKNRQMCNNFGLILVDKKVLPNRFFLSNSFPSGVETWGFFHEYFLQTIDASEDYLMSDESEKAQEWLLKEVYYSSNSQRKTLAIAEFVLVYVDEHNDPDFKKIIFELEKTKTKEAWLSDIGFSQVRANRISLANEKIEKLLNSMAFEEFFASFAFDKARKDFWSACLPYLTKVKVFLPPILYRKLSVNTNYNGRFAHVDASSAPAVLVMQVHNFIIVEFGVSGNALYVYDEHDEIYNTIISSFRMRDVASFKSPSLSMLLRTSKHGRLIHTDGIWQNKMRSWLLYNTQIRI